MGKGCTSTGIVGLATLQKKLGARPWLGQPVHEVSLSAAHGYQWELASTCTSLAWHASFTEKAWRVRGIAMYYKLNSITKHFIAPSNALLHVVQ